MTIWLPTRCGPGHPLHLLFLKALDFIGEVFDLLLLVFVVLWLGVPDLGQTTLRLSRRQIRFSSQARLTAKPATESDRIRIFGQAGPRQSRRWSVQKSPLLVRPQRRKRVTAVLTALSVVILFFVAKVLSEVLVAPF